MHDRDGSFSRKTSLNSTLTRRTLADLKRKAIRRGLWFKLLSKVERSCIDITIKVVTVVRSRRLTKVLVPVVQKLLEAMENRLGQSMWQVGYEHALKMSRIAQAWGNSSAIQWSKDSKFVRYLTIMRINTSEIQKT